MRELFRRASELDDKPMTEAEIASHARGRRVGSDDHVPINAHMNRPSWRSMKLIANFGNGVDHIDVTSALRRGIHRHEILLASSPKYRRQ